MKFIEYDVTADKLCVGERNKGGRYKPTSTTLRYSQLVGALTNTFGKNDFHAVGYIRSFQIEFLSYNLKDRYTDEARLPLKIQFMTNVAGKAFVTCAGVFDALQHDFSLHLGAMISKGFGKCRFKFVRIIDLDNAPARVGLLNTRIPLRASSDRQMTELRATGKSTDFLKNCFGITQIFKPRFGYLFKPVDPYTGNYELALFEGSKISGHNFLLQ